ncbi:MAG: hypothetical protein U0S12_13385 [Fimbriimonadales bacterium]
MSMNVGNVTPNLAGLDPTSNVESKRLQLQVALLKKSLDVQKQQAEELQRMFEGKGQVLDLRV